jgi:hypothetical protein
MDTVVGVVKENAEKILSKPAAWDVFMYPLVTDMLFRHIWQFLKK